MYTYRHSGMPNTRIDVADILRGIAIGGIVLIHFIEHMNFYKFPEPHSQFWASVNSGVWDTVFFLLAGKMYAIFAMLFGLSFYIQHDNCAQKGYDFRLRFIWRMVLLMLFGLFDLLFYNGDILFLYAVCGLLAIPFIRASDKVLKWSAVFLMLQPVEMALIFCGIADPSTPVFDLGSGRYWSGLMSAQEHGSMAEVAAAGIKYGFPVNFVWALENGRMTQTLFLFLFGIILGRKRLFYDEGNNIRTWKRILAAASCAFAILLPLYAKIPGICETACISKSLHVMFNMWKNFAMMLMIVSGTVLLFYRTPARKKMMKIAPYGKMSLTNYLGQSIVGGMLFYNWGFGLFRICGHTSSLLLGIIFVIIQYAFCRLWLAHHKRGPFEELWYKATWVHKQ